MSDKTADEQVMTEFAAMAQRETVMQQQVAEMHQFCTMLADAINEASANPMVKAMIPGFTGLK